MNRLLSYYQKELSFLKQHGKIFASRFPKIARRLGIAEGESEDPHISRLIESFALLTSRIHQRLDDEMPDVIDALLSVLAPQFLRPLPSVCIMNIAADPLRSGITGKNRLPPGSALFSRQSVPVSCQFQTVYPVDLLPLSLREAALQFDTDDLNWQLRLRFEVWPGARLADDTIRLYLHGPNNAVNTLYTLLCSEIKTLMLCKGENAFSLPASALSPVGFEAEESLLTRDPRIAPVHILLLDYFYFPQKFSFIDLQLPAGFSAAGNDVFELCAVFQRNALTERLEKLTGQVDAHFFRLHCTPAINLFSQRAEPILLTDATAEYPVVPDTRHHGTIEVWSIDQVFVQRKSENRIEHFPVMPLLGNRFCHAPESASGLSWQSFYRDVANKQGVERKQFIAFSVHKDRQPPAGPEIVTLGTLCTNHAVPYQMQYGQPDGDFDIEAPIAGLKITALTHPTRPVNPPEKSEVRWRFLSQLSLNHQLLDGESGAQQLKEMLALYNFDDSPGNIRLFSMIQTIGYQPVTARLIRNDPHSQARGLDLTVIFSQEALQEPDYYLLCSFLDRLLALYAPVNSFTRLTTCIDREAQTRRVWPIRAGKLSWL
ncbi:type VI secretion system baseplate subunit TssF [Pseudescherichia sp.]|uniref:type VI secretion system baseplate subunit TssF n=1 Tax=Pseudescherichia sp. TaxID=2055881 RepID=UPI00289A63B8|nr:type VI secretion system baseplate subunit TssF [Pseudescherichia sp.]